MQKGQEKGIYTILHRLAEEVEDHTRALKDVAVLIDKLSTVLIMQEKVAEGMQNHINKILRVDDDDERSTHELVTVKSEKPDGD